ncbi:AlpA family phage regulatory protein [Ochrobactrum sp. C6C9]|uniref:helix-turn-helix transcriptional regulator n=1 Tax=Ochrobactrum sp. C6C9 TaxID=2736662 RepID=UPI0035301AF0|nr:AlpA family phage regulatory protein [Ochrobactrum sp. C6C9]
MTPLHDRFINCKEVLHIVGLSRPHLYRLIAADDFPVPVKLGCAARWSLNAVQEWMAKKVREAA